MESMITAPSEALRLQGGAEPGWKAAATLAARLVYAAIFALAAIFKLADIGGTAGYIAAVGFPFATALAWCAALFEILLILGFLSGALFTATTLLSALYVLFLGITFHGPAHWGQDAMGQMEFGAFVSHFPFAAGLLFAAAYGPGRFALRRLRGG
jgi:uncharacterized membrane protein YphA (DoxX/SURF4 family)